MAAPTLLEALHKQLLIVADPRKAPDMQAYMKSDMPYLGVSAVPLRKCCKQLFGNAKYGSTQAWQKDVKALWRGATFREERYASIELTGIRSVQPFQHVSALPMYEEMIVTGAWWDYVDTIATQRLIVLLHNDPAEMKRTMLTWSTCDNIWKRRSAILCQIKAKSDTDFEFLYRCIEPSLDSSEFFLRKAIGWALRQYAWTDPKEVMRYVKANEMRLSGLSKREALKNIS